MPGRLIRVWPCRQRNRALSLTSIIRLKAQNLKFLHLFHLFRQGNGSHSDNRLLLTSLQLLSLPKPRKLLLRVSLRWSCHRRSHPSHHFFHQWRNSSNLSSHRLSASKQDRPKTRCLVKLTIHQPTEKQRKSRKAKRPSNCHQGRI